MSVFRYYFWPRWPEARAKGSGAGPLPFVTGTPPRRASGAGRTAAPTDRHSPFAAASARPGTGRGSCWHGWPPD